MEGSTASNADRGQQLRSVGTSVGLTVAGFLTAVVVFGVGIVTIGAVGIDLQQQPILFAIAGIVLQGVGFGVAVVLYMAVTDNWGLVGLRVPTLRDVGWTVGGLVALFAGYLGIVAIVSLLNVTPAENSIVEAGQQNPGLVPLLIPLAILVVGPSEELLFRGAIQGVLRRSYSAVPAIAIASSLFGVAHVFALLGGPLSGILVYISVTFVLGMILGAIYERTENIVVPSLVHGVYNAILFTSLYFQVSGGV
ncbi:CPBP family intramembrane metalloprotease [Salinirubellus salinus]|uniref:CPBP family intramembrane metalloprotease n=1 Tax=Salinirubellus salinus TaxID=1364945 RepID=A0A9E7QZU5_9EURY|nr:type II CAAX endopeptidase family protein [Salinirubellus salinus]UWM52963.1 CPBP family intramembrane metalloprotease [Salinirubellus salinus]